MKKQPTQPPPAQSLFDKYFGAWLCLMLIGAAAICLTVSHGVSKSDPCKKGSYRIVTDGNNFKIQKRTWPFGWYDHDEGGSWPILAAQEQTINNMVSRAIAKRDYIPPDWIEVTPQIRHRFTNEPVSAWDQGASHGVWRINVHEGAWGRSVFTNGSSRLEVEHGPVAPTGVVERIEFEVQNH